MHRRKPKKQDLNDRVVELITQSGNTICGADARELVSCLAVAVEERLRALENAVGDHRHEQDICVSEDNRRAIEHKVVFPEKMQLCIDPACQIPATCGMCAHFRNFGEGHTACVGQESSVSVKADTLACKNWRER